MRDPFGWPMDYGIVAPADSSEAALVEILRRVV